MNQNYPSAISCPQCHSDFPYESMGYWICPECANEWPITAHNNEEAIDTGIAVTKDANGNLLTTGDTVTVIKDLKVKGSSLVVKVGTKVKNIRIVESDDGHPIACRIDGVGSMNLKPEFVKKLSDK